MYENENIAWFHDELSAYFASSDQPYALDRWRMIEVRYPELLANWLTSHPDFTPPQEQGIRIGKRLDHLKGGRRNLKLKTARVPCPRQRSRPMSGKALPPFGRLADLTSRPGTISTLNFAE